VGNIVLRVKFEVDIFGSVIVVGIRKEGVCDMFANCVVNES